MLGLMSPQIDLLNEHLPAISTAVGPVSRVKPLVYFLVLFQRETSATVRTVPGLLTSVDDRVSSELRLLLEPPPALLTFEGSGLSMVQHVELKLLPVKKISAADPALDVLQLLPLPVTLTSFPGTLLARLGQEMFMVKPAVSLDVELEGEPSVTVRTAMRIVQLGLPATDWCTTEVQLTSSLMPSRMSLWLTGVYKRFLHST